MRRAEENGQRESKSSSGDAPLAARLTERLGTDLARTRADIARFCGDWIGDLQSSAVCEALPNLPCSREATRPAHTLIKISGSELVRLDGPMHRFLKKIFAGCLEVDGLFAYSQTQDTNSWVLRNRLNLEQARHGSQPRTNTSTPPSRSAGFAAKAEAAIRPELPDCVRVSYGHAGDGDAHLNILRDVFDPTRIDARTLAVKNAFTAALDCPGSPIRGKHRIGWTTTTEFGTKLPAALVTAIRPALHPAAANRGVDSICSDGARG